MNTCDNKRPWIVKIAESKKINKFYFIDKYSLQ